MLGFGSTRACERAAESLVLASTPEERRAAVATLIRLGRRSRSTKPWVALALHLHHLDEGDRTQVLAAGAERWVEVAQFLATSPEVALRRAGVELGGECDAPEVILALGAGLGDADASIADAAAGGVERVSRRVLGGAGATRDVREALQNVLCEGLARLDRHRRSEIVRASIAMMATPAARRTATRGLTAWFDEGDDVAHREIRAALRKGAVGMSPAEARERAWQMLVLGGVERACVERVLTPEAGDGAGPYGRMLGSAYLVAHPARARAWARGVKVRAKDAEGVFADERFIGPDDDRAAMRVARVLGAAGQESAWNAAIGLLADPRAAVRWSLVREIVERDGPADVMLDAAMDEDPRVACAAVRAGYTPWGRARLGRQTLARLTGTLARSGHGPIRELAAAVFDAQTPWCVDDTGSRLLARRMVRSDRAGFVVELRRRVLEEAGGIAVRIGGLRVAERLGLGAEIETDLRTLIRRSAMPSAMGNADERRVAATAVRVLAGAGTATAMRSVIEATRHPDPRVRANAADGLTRMVRRGHTPASETAAAARAIVELKNDAHHRVRASAIRAEMTGVLIGVSDGGGRRAGGASALALVRPLLVDERAEHRIAGLWLMERTVSECRDLPWEGVAGTVAGMVHADGSEAVRVRARRCAAALLSRMTPGWGGQGA